MASTINIDEVNKFSALAEQWWDENGKFKTLHQLNPVRLKYIKEKSLAHFNLPDNLTPFSGVKVLDIGCGGGLLTQPMAKLGADITGIDASAKNINAAIAHSQKVGVKINYQCGKIEDVTEKFDIILNMEVVEHVADPVLFLSACASLLKPNGLMFLATINRTAKSYLYAILGAEYVLRLLPIGMHSWKTFLKPSEVNNIVQEKLLLQDVVGVSYNPITTDFKLTSDTSVNYMMLFIAN